MQPLIFGPLGERIGQICYYLNFNIIIENTRIIQDTLFSSKKKFITCKDYNKAKDEKKIFF
jgi:hypothetical protein